MPGFKILRDDRDKGAEPLQIATVAAAVGDLLELVAGSVNWALVTSSSLHFTRKAIAMEISVSGDVEVKAIVLDGLEHVEAEGGSDSDVADNGDRMAATDEDTVNNSGTDVSGQAVVFVQRGIIGAATDKRVWGNVLVGSGVDPDAA